MVNVKFKTTYSTIHLKTIDKKGVIFHKHYIKSFRQYKSTGKYKLRQNLKMLV